ncbi:MAG: sulfatase-like hydrolase/transferase, partial [Phenylobacterium sp.]
MAESFEVLRLQGGGIAPPGWGLRAALWLAYSGAALLFYGAAALFSRRRGLTIAGVAFSLLLVLPWLNFAYLPRFGSGRSLFGTAAAALLVAVLVPLLLRVPRAVGAAVLLLAVATSAGPLIAGRDGGRTAVPAGQTPPPFNVVVVLIDTLRADHTGAYGYTRPTSPHFDAVAREGVVFEQTVAQAPWTKPSVASLMTGVFVHKHGVVSSRDALGSERPTLAEALRERGYRTAAFSGNPWITPEFRFDRGFDSFESGRAMGAQLTNLYKV